MHFGITIKPDMTVQRILALTQQAEACGFEYGWIFDSHVLWIEPYPILTLMATNTKRMRLGTCVTNPATRDITVTSSLYATLNLMTAGRRFIWCRPPSDMPASPPPAATSTPAPTTAPAVSSRCKAAARIHVDLNPKEGETIRRWMRNWSGLSA